VGLWPQSHSRSRSLLPPTNGPWWTVAPPLRNHLRARIVASLTARARAAGSLRARTVTKKMRLPGGSRCQMRPQPLRLGTKLRAGRFASVPISARSMARAWYKSDLWRRYPSPYLRDRPPKNIQSAPHGQNCRGMGWTCRRH
jgi:hypothetical protein